MYNILQIEIFESKIDKYDTYKKYIQSTQWKKRRIKYVISIGFKCEKCGSRNGLHVHHINYENLGNEKDIDLLCLCHTCHEIYHSSCYYTNCLVAEMIIGDNFRPKLSWHHGGHSKEQILKAEEWSWKQ